jgi:hypothetical protein
MHKARFDLVVKPMHVHHRRGAAQPQRRQLSALREAFGQSSVSFTMQSLGAA